ncbi:hypothetical protein [Methylocella silvestris]|uniref:Uncharacterized protein n=1 Tax=Methylocella silvestris TaxID=199596 RepID=A0A2J7TBV0_METSI|nr:hypothetical protein [Methylocella silvestris]PNG24238.1 hypothetical protein CR492_19820 [Methylocella silvestris]
MIKVGAKSSALQPQAVESEAPSESPATALARADAERLAALAEREQLIGRRAEMLAGEAADDEVEVVDLAIARANRTIERRQLALPALRSRAEDARRQQTEADFAAFYDRYRQAQNDFGLAYGAAVETRARLAAIVDAAASRFAGRVSAFMAYPVADLTLEPTRLEAFESDAERAFAAERRRLEGDW